MYNIHRDDIHQRKQNVMHEMQLHDDDQRRLQLGTMASNSRKLQHRVAAAVNIAPAHALAVQQKAA